MPFRALSVLKPSWWFTRAPARYWVDSRKLGKWDRACIDDDGGYVSEHARLFDAAYQAFCKGVLADSEQALDQSLTSVRVPAADEYRFVAKYFSHIWLPYFFLMRCLALHNPISEARGLVRALGVVRRDPYERVARHPAYEDSVVPGDLGVTVIIPTLNRYEHLAHALEDLCAQTCVPAEVVIVDQSEPFRPEVYEHAERAGLALRVIRQEEPALWRARNRAIRECDADLLLLFDDDSRVEPDWIEQHLRALIHFGVDISSGVSLSAVGDTVPRSYYNFRWSDQLDTGNVLIRRSVFEAIGLFDRQFEGQRMGDGEFGLRAFRAGFRNLSHPLAKRVHLKVSTGGLRQMGSWDAFRPTRLFAPRPVPSVLYLIRRYFGNQAAVYQLLISVPLSLVPYRFKGSRPLKLLGCLLALFFLPLVFVQVVVSWRAASRKIRAGPSIEAL